ncbi:MAG: HEAT repeat domain-containing protein [Deferrisomatales bacterium]|nr:HEAT repeat domain-containing protein [Deferrisomatales bacterium]
MKALLDHLSSEDKIRILQGLEGLADRLPDLDGPDFEEAVHGIISLFYLDPMDHPELVPVLEQAEHLLADQRTRAIPAILDALAESDLKVHFHLAAALGRMGHAAVEPLLCAYREAEEPYVRIFALYALGKVKDPKVIRAVPALFEALEDPHPELRDTAARALGKLVEHLDPNAIPYDLRRELFRRLHDKVRDRFAGVRSKAVRSLGKMARFGLLERDEAEAATVTLAGILGEGEGESWDLAYIVRLEAQRARRHLSVPPR